MSLYKLTDANDLAVKTYFKNTLLGDQQYEFLYADDRKVDDTGRVYKFSVFDCECNLFRYRGNTFLNKLKVDCTVSTRRHYVFNYVYKPLTARPKLCGSHTSIEELESCPA